MTKNAQHLLVKPHKYQLFNKLRLIKRELYSEKNADFHKKFVVKLTFLAIAMHIL